mgnify:CR=1 FL=1
MLDFQDRASLSCPRLSEGQVGLRVVLGIRRRDEGLVEPGHQIAVGEAQRRLEWVNSAHFRGKKVV